MRRALMAKVVKSGRYLSADVVGTRIKLRKELFRAVLRETEDHTWQKPMRLPHVTLEYSPQVLKRVNSIVEVRLGDLYFVESVRARRPCHWAVFEADVPELDFEGHMTAAWKPYVGEIQ